MRTFKKLIIFAVVMGFITTSNADLITIPACEDLYVICGTTPPKESKSFIPYLKFDISVVPPGKEIDSVFLRVFAFNKGADWDDGDLGPDSGICMCNFHNQTWTEDTTREEVYHYAASLYSDSVFDPEFGIGSIGEIFSVDIKPIFLCDYDSSHTYCSIRMWGLETDFHTFPVLFDPFDEDTSITIGDNLLRDILLHFRPHEFSPDSAPTLFVYYSESGVEEKEIRDKRLEIRAYPNPFTEHTVIRCQVPEVRCQNSEVRLTIYDLGGRLIREWNLGFENFHEVAWDGCDELGNPVAGGIYFYTLTVGDYTKTKKMCLMR